jgi:ParB family chromosome partitioning protein
MLQEVIAKLGRFLDPIVAVPAPNGGFWTPNGNHRREALRRLGREYIPAVVVPDPQVAFEILALNTEKAHNLKEKALEVIRMYRALLSLRNPQKRRRSSLSSSRRPTWPPWGLSTRKSERFLRLRLRPQSCEKWTGFWIWSSPWLWRSGKRRAGLLLEVDALVEPIVQALRERGYTQPFVKHGVVSKVNPVKRKKIVTMSFDEAMARMKAALSALEPEKLRVEELAEAIEE